MSDASAGSGGVPLGLLLIAGFLVIAALSLAFIEIDCPSCEGGTIPILWGIGTGTFRPRACGMCGDFKVSLFQWVRFRTGMISDGP